MALTVYENVPVLLGATLDLTADRTFDLCMTLAVGDTDADIPATPIPFLMFYNKQTQQVQLYTAQMGWGLLTAFYSEEPALAEPLIFFNTATGDWRILIGTT